MIAGSRRCLPSCLDDYVAEDNPVRVIDVFVDELDLASLGFEVTPAATGRPAYHPATLLKLYVYGYLNQVQSSRRLEREAQRNVELMWLTGKLAPDHKTIADFRKDNGPAIQAACAQFVVLCRQLGLFAQAVAAVDGSKFKAVNTRDKNFTADQAEEADRAGRASTSPATSRTLDTADRQEGEAAEARSAKLKDKIATLRAQMQMLKAMEAEVAASPDGQVSLTDPDARSMATSGRGSGIVGYNVQTAVDAEHHLIVAHDVVMTGQRPPAARRDQRGRPRPPWAWSGSRCWPTAATSPARRSWPARRMGVTPYVPKPLTSAPRPTGASASRTLSTCPSRTSIAARPASCSRTT